MMFGEKFVEKKVEGNKMIIITEFKEFDYDYEQIAMYYNDFIDGDFENQYYTAGIGSDYEDFYSLDCDQMQEALHETMEEWEKENLEGEENDVEQLKNFIDELEKAKGYTIYFKRDKDYYTKGYKAGGE